MDTKHLDQYIADRFYKERVVRRFTQDDVARMLTSKLSATTKTKVARTTYACYEHVDRSMPQEIFKALCDIFEIDDVALFKEAQQFMLDCYVRESKGSK